MYNHDKESINTFRKTHKHSAGKKERLAFIYTEAYIGLPARYFENKVIGDLGCGNHGESIEFFISNRPAKVIGVDLDTAQCREILMARGLLPSKSVELIDASLENLPISDGLLDFVWCQGVIHHVEHPERAVSEIARCLKAGGSADFMIIGGNNLMSKIVFDACRAHYREDEEFRKLFENDDNMIINSLITQLRWLKNEMTNDGSQTYKLCCEILNNLSELIDTDFIQTLRDRLQPPTYTTWDKQKWIRLFGDHRLVLKRDLSGMNAKPRFDNIRKIFEPLYRNPKSVLGKFLYGNGSSYRLIFERK